MVFCVAFRCCNNSNDGNYSGSFHKFPKEKKLRKIWRAKVNFDPDKYYRAAPHLCGEHFEVTTYDKHPETARLLGIRIGLKKDAVPTIFSKKREGNPPETEPKRIKSTAILKRQNLEVS